MSFTNHTPSSILKHFYILHLEFCGFTFLRINQKINYIHLNPVRAGIVEFPEHFIYSSARNYLGEIGILEIEVIDVDSNAKYF